MTETSGGQRAQRMPEFSLAGGSRMFSEVEDGQEGRCADVGTSGH